jgi:uncharacterized protein (UPF0276 family)
MRKSLTLRTLAVHLAQYNVDRSNHRDHVRDEVWALYVRTLRRAGPVSTLIEWDENIPPFDVVLAEAEKARSYQEKLEAASHAV